MKTLTKYEAKDYGYLLGQLDGISDEALKLHFTLYNGYVAKTNEVQEKIEKVDKSTANHNYSDLRSLMIDHSHNLNGVVLHELYFSNLTGEKTEPSEDFKTAIAEEFSSWDAYIDDLKATGKASRAGWAMTIFNERDGRIHNFAIDQHDLHVPVFVKPLLIMDVWEHAYTTDYGTGKPDYINAFIKNVDWDVVSNRYDEV